MMTSIIFGVGVGLVILIAVWLIAICIGLVSLRTRRNVGTITVIIATIFTIVLLIIPLDSKTPTPAVFRIYDEIFIWRSSLLVLLAISSILGFIAYLVSHLMEPRLVQPIKNKRL